MAHGNIRKKPGRPKPPIWADGRQAPRFELKPFLAASTSNARRLAARALDAASLAGRRAASAFRDGTWRLPPERLGRTGRYLPDHRALAQTCTATARLTAAAGTWAAGRSVQPVDFEDWQADPPANEPVAPSPLRYVRPPRHRAAAHAVEVDAETLAAIRSVVQQANVMPVRPLRVPAAAPEPSAPAPAAPRAARLPEIAPAEPAPPSRAFRLGAAVIGAAVIALVWPAGAVQALMAHLNGEDLRNLAP